MVAVNLRAGRCAEATLELGRPSGSQLARARGTLSVHEAWKLEPKAIRFTSLDVPSELREAKTAVLEPVSSSLAGFEAFAWKETELQVGSYEVLIQGTGYRVAFDLPAGGRDDIELVVPPPTEVSLLVVDAATALPVEHAWVQWAPCTRHDFEHAPPAVAPGVFRFRAPVTRIDVEVQATEGMGASATFDLEQGLNPKTIRLQRPCGFTLRFMDGQTSFGPPRNCRVSVASTTRQGVRNDYSESQTDGRWTVRPPGTYFVLVSDLPGYKTIPLQQVQVPESGYAEHVIQLERRE
jgi:hypothetical protein